MLQLHCPFCGLRSEHEFICTGEHSERPTQPDTVDDATWASHLYDRRNPDSPVIELWWHQHGCRSWLRVRRDPHTQSILDCQSSGGAS